MIIGISHIKSRDNFYNKPHNLLNSSSSFSQLISGLSWNSGFNKLVAFTMSGRILCSVTLGFPIDSVLHLSAAMASATSVCSVLPCSYPYRGVSHRPPRVLTRSFSPSICHIYHACFCVVIGLRFEMQPYPHA